jgi:hypothetical protein
LLENARTWRWSNLRLETPSLPPIDPTSNRERELTHTSRMVIERDGGVLSAGLLPVGAAAIDAGPSESRRPPAPSTAVPSSTTIRVSWSKRGA